MRRTDSLALVGAAVLAFTRVAHAQTVVVPALSAHASDPGDHRAWTIATRIDERFVTVVATAASAALAVTLRHARQGDASCHDALAALLATPSLDALATPQPTVFRAAPFEPGAFRQDASTHDAEFGCARINEATWTAAAIARPRAGVALADTASIAIVLVRALAAAGARAGFPVRLDVSGLELDDPSDRAAWLFTGRADGFPLPADAVSSSAGDPGGVTLSIARTHGDCAAAWRSVRASTGADGALVDRPGYVPAAFGTRIRRFAMGERTREIYCVDTARGATTVAAVFGATDADAMARIGPMLRAIATGTARELLGAAH